MKISDIKINSPIKNEIAHKGTAKKFQTEKPEIGASSLDALGAQGKALVNLNKTAHLKNESALFEKYKRGYEKAGFSKKDAEILADEKINNLGAEIMEGYDEYAVRDYLDYNEAVRKAKFEILHARTGYSDKEAEKAARKKVKESDFYPDNLTKNVDNFEKVINITKHAMSFLCGYGKSMSLYLTFAGFKDHKDKRALSVVGHKLREDFLREFENIPNLLECDSALKYHIENTTLKDMVEILDVFSVFEGKYRVKADGSFRIKSPITTVRAKFKKNKSGIAGIKRAAADKFKGKKNPVDEILQTGGVSKQTPEFLETLDKVNPDDFIHDVKMLDCVFPMMCYIQKHPNSPISNHMYNRYYLPAIYCELKENMINEDTAEAFINIMSYINEHYGTKIFTGRINSENQNEAFSALTSIDEEFIKWKNAAANAGEKAKFPAIFDFYTAKRRYLASGNRLTRGTSSGYLHLLGGNALSLREMTKEIVELVLRHEMTHLNDTKLLDTVKSIKNLKFTNDTQENRDLQSFWIDNFEKTSKMSINEIRKLPYYCEFEKADIDESYILYAYNDPCEFIAVASQGDMSKYSPEFKQLLVDLGMPEWEFGLEQEDTEEIAVNRLEVMEYCQKAGISTKDAEKMISMQEKYTQEFKNDGFGDASEELALYKARYVLEGQSEKYAECSAKKELERSNDRKAYENAFVHSGFSKEEAAEIAENILVYRKILGKAIPTEVIKNDNVVRDTILQYCKNGKTDKMVDLIRAIGQFEGIYGKSHVNSNDILNLSGKFSCSSDNPNDNYILRILKGENTEPTEAEMKQLGDLRPEAFAHDVDMKNAAAGIISIIRRNPDSDIAKHLYGRYYLCAVYTEVVKNTGSTEIAETILDKLTDISTNKDYKTMVFLGLVDETNYKDVIETLEYINDELEAWKLAAKASGKEPKYPPTLDFYTADTSYLADGNHLTGGTSGGYSLSSGSGSISLRKMAKAGAAWSLRHEMTHSNDTKLLGTVEKIKNLNFTNDTQKNRDLQTFWINNFEKSSKMSIDEIKKLPYYNEFLNGGLDESDIPYAYNNPKEFIARASQGNMSKYSSEFKQLLVDLGMPEWEIEHLMSNSNVRHYKEYVADGYSDDDAKALTRDKAEYIEKGFPEEEAHDEAVKDLTREKNRLKFKKEYKTQGYNEEDAEHLADAKALFMRFGYSKQEAEEHAIKNLEYEIARRKQQDYFESLGCTKVAAFELAREKVQNIILYGYSDKEAEEAAIDEFISQRGYNPINGQSADQTTPSDTDD